MRRIEYKVNDTLNVERLGGPCRIVRVHPFGTVDVESPSGGWFRVTGLPMFEREGGRK